MEMPLRKLQEIIIDCTQYFFKVARNLARSSSIDYPYQGPVFAFALEGDRLKLTDNTQVPVTSQDGRVVMENVNPGRFDIPRRNKVQAAFLKFEHWQNRILENRIHADSENLERELEIITGNMLPLAVKMLKYTAESYSIPDPLADNSKDYWTHPPCDLSCRAGMLESGDHVPAKIQLKVEQLNDLLREAERRLKRARATEPQHTLPESSEVSRKIIRRLVQEVILDYAGDMVLAGKQKDAESIVIVKDGTNPFPATAVEDAATLKTKTRNTSIPEASSKDLNPDPRPNRRKGQTGLRNANDAQSGPITAAERFKAVEDYLDEVLEKTGKRITKTAFWKSAHYKTRSEFERWQRNDPRCTRTARERFARLLREKPHLK
jgi:hypothetical protein